MEAVGFFLFPLDEKITEELMTTLTSFQDPWLKKKSSRLVDLNKNNVWSPNYSDKSPREFIEKYNSKYPGKKFKPNGRWLNLCDDSKITMEDLITIWDLPIGDQPQNRSNFADWSRNDLKKTVEIFCNEYQISIPDYRKQTINKGVLSKPDQNK